MKRLYILICMLSLLPLTAVDAQVNYEGDLKYTVSVRKDGPTVRAKLIIDYSSIELGRQDMITITPVIRANDGSRAETMLPVVIAGPKRYRKIMRDRDFGLQVFEDEPAAIVEYRNRNTDKKFEIDLNQPYAAWLRDAKFAVTEEVSGCFRCTHTLGDVFVSEMLGPVYVPDYRVVFINPPVEDPKQRSESYVSYLNFEVNQSRLLRNYKNNADVLKEVDRIMTELVNDPDLKVTRFQVTGYASPEGNAADNQNLSEMRAKALLDYLKDKFGYNVNTINHSSLGEDWDGLYKALELSDIADRDIAMSIIRDTKDIAERKRQIQALPSYRYMLDNLYPPLRRNVYEISFIARGFDVEEAKRIVKTRPHLLSQNELYLVAQTYQKGSPEFKEIFRIAGRVFPEDPYANINYGAIAVEEGDPGAVTERLQNVEMAEAYNNLAIAYFKTGSYELAEKYFRLAERYGLQEGSHNLAEFLKWKDNF